MALNTFKCNCLTPLHFKGLTNGRMTTWGPVNWLSVTVRHDGVAGQIYTLTWRLR